MLAIQDTPDVGRSYHNWSLWRQDSKPVHVLCNFSSI